MSKYGAHESAAYSKIDTDRDPENETRSYFILKFLNDALDTYGCIMCFCGNTAGMASHAQFKMGLDFTG